MEAYCLVCTALPGIGRPLPEHRLKSAPRPAARFVAARLVQVDAALRAFQVWEHALLLADQRVGEGGMESHSGAGMQGFSQQDGVLFATAFGREEEGEFRAALRPHPGRPGGRLPARCQACGPGDEEELSWLEAGLGGGAGPVAAPPSPRALGRVGVLWLPPGLGALWQWLR